MKIILKQDARTVKFLAKSFNLLVVTLILSGLLVKTQAKTMREADCKPRPVPVAVTEGHDVLPYHVLLHRCSGTCENTSPRVKSCEAHNSVEITLDVTDVHNRPKTIKVANHTSCVCKCKCRPNEIPLDKQSCDCKCIKNCELDLTPPTAAGARNYGEQKKVCNPYLFGMVAVGLFAIIVLLFDATLYIKKKIGVCYSVKHCCCSNKKEKLEAKCNGQRNGNRQHTVV